MTSISFEFVMDLVERRRAVRDCDGTRTRSLVADLVAMSGAQAVLSPYWHGKPWRPRPVAQTRAEIFTEDGLIAPLFKHFSRTMQFCCLRSIVD
ncbi:hypothetical protein [Paraburkholderia adhaesiva]|uniref:hypothetical protein n=1 Tax=Paraburkholderia adhaesiva TaxID=2883244 RepID=UPI001F270D8A|nr:hypothetical protein [Paraburkholderia adhaesiva]